jgi:hypothetical protein
MLLRCPSGRSCSQVTRAASACLVAMDAIKLYCGDVRRLHRAGAAAVALQYRAGRRQVWHKVSSSTACVVSEFGEPIGSLHSGSLFSSCLRVRLPKKRRSYQNCLSAPVMAVLCVLCVGITSVSHRQQPTTRFYFRRRGCRALEPARASTAQHYALSSISRGFRVH